MIIKGITIFARPPGAHNIKTVVTMVITAITCSIYDTREIFENIQVILF